MRTYVYILGRDLIVCATHDINKIYEIAVKKGSFGEPYFNWSRIQIWENEKQIKTITVSGNHLIKMPKDKEELWQMLNE